MYRRRARAPEVSRPARKDWTGTPGGTVFSDRRGRTRAPRGRERGDGEREQQRGAGLGRGERPGARRRRVEDPEVGEVVVRVAVGEEAREALAVHRAGRRLALAREHVGRGEHAVAERV